MTPMSGNGANHPPVGSTIEPGILQSALVLNGRWHPSYAAFMQRYGILELNVNYAKGFVGDDLTFLREVPFLKGLTLITYNISNVSNIHILHELRALNLGSRDKTPID